MKIIDTKEAPAAVGPYSQACDMGDYVFCSGAIPLDPVTGEVCGTTIEEQAHRVFQNLKAVLNAAGLDFGDVCKTTVFLQSMGDFGALNSVYNEYFKAPYPARSCVEVGKLPKNVMVECECIAKRK